MFVNEMNSRDEPIFVTCRDRRLIIHYDWICNPETLNSFLHHSGILSERKLRSMNTKNDKPILFVLALPFLQIWKDSLATYTGIVPELNQNNSPPQCGDKNWLRVKPKVAEQFVRPDGLWLYFGNSHRDALMKFLKPQKKIEKKTRSYKQAGIACCSA